MTELEKQLIEQNQQLLEQVRQLQEQLQYFTRKFFGSSREKVIIPSNQLSLFEGEDFLMNQRKLKAKPSKK